MQLRREGLIGGVLLLASGSALAADLPVPAETVEIVAPSVEPRWSFGIAPYLWAASISGDVAAFGAPEVHVDASFSDLFQNLEFGAMLVSELRYGRWGLFSDLVYVKLGGSSATPDQIVADSASVDAQTLIFTAAGEYRFVENPRGSVDAMAGARVWAVDTDVSLRGGLIGSASASDDETWVDPVIGLKGRFNLTDKFYLSAWGMVGGFDVSSKFMWDAWGGVGYDFNKTFSALVGYRALGVDFEDNGFVFDVTEYGPILGGVIRF